MKLVSYLKEGHDQLAMLVNGFLYDADDVHPELPSSMSMMLNYWEDYFPLAAALSDDIQKGTVASGKGIPVDEVVLLAPVPQPASYREAGAFPQHVATVMDNRSLKMSRASGRFPAFYFANHHSMQGPGDIRCMPDHFQQLDFSLEVAIIICRHGRNITAAEADEYIGGFLIMNGITARRLQQEETPVNSGRAAVEKFATATGPWLVTPDELAAYKVAAKPGHTGNNYHLAMRCRVNGVQVSEGSLADMEWTFAEIIERCAYGTELYPGDIIGSGTAGMGCFLELNATASPADPDYKAQWLQEGDVTELEVEGLGILQNTIIADDSTFSLL